MGQLTIKEIKGKLNTQQILAAELLTENEFAGSDRRTLDEIAEEVGLTVRGLYKWRQDPTFIRYQSYISDRRLESARTRADAQLMKLVDGTSMNGIPSVKGLEMYYKLIGRMSNTADITIHEGERKPRISAEEVGQGLDELNAMLDKE